MNKNELRSSGEPRSGGFANGVSEPMSFSLGGKKVPYFTSYNFKEQALRNF